MAELQEGSKYQIDPVDGTLTIRGLRISDTNVYHCIATNYLNNDTAATTITVEGMCVLYSAKRWQGKTLANW